MKETWWQTCRVGRGSRLIAIWRRLEAVALATAMISSFAFVPLCAYANETGSKVVSGGGEIAYTNADAKSAFDFLSHREDAERAQGERRCACMP